MSIIARFTILLVLLSLMFLVSLQPVASEDNKIIVEYFYGEGCSTCNETKPIINNIEQYYGDKITVQRYSIEDNPETENYKRWHNYMGLNIIQAL